MGKVEKEKATNNNMPFIELVYSMKGALSARYQKIIMLNAFEINVQRPNKHRQHRSRTVGTVAWI